MNADPNFEHFATDTTNPPPDMGPVQPALTFEQQTIRDLIEIERLRLEVQLSKARTDEGRANSVVAALPLLLELFSKLGLSVSTTSGDTPQAPQTPDAPHVPTPDVPEPAAADVS